jgi:Putative zinc-finger
MTTMNPQTDPEHRALWDLIPWVVAGSASTSDQQRVQQHLLRCEDCRDEMAFHQSLHGGMHSSASQDSSADEGLARLWARVDEAQVVAGPAPQPSANGRQRWLVAAVLVQAIGLAAMAGLLLQRQPEAGYQTLSSGAAHSAAVVRLVPAPEMPVAQLSALLSRHGLQIVESNHDGTLLGLARMPVPSTPTSAANTTAPELAQRLRAEAGVLLAEPILNSSGR